MTISLGEVGEGQQVFATPSAQRQINAFGGQLYVSSTSGERRGLLRVGSGLPTGSATLTTVAGIPTDNTLSAGAFFFADLSAAVAGFDTVYIADESGTAGSVRKFCLVGSTWQSYGSASMPTMSAPILRPIGLAATVLGTAVTVYVTRGNGLFRVVDSGGYQGQLSGSPTLLAQPEGSSAFRGVALAPEGPTAVRLSSSQALSTSNGTEIRWRSAFEADNLGFHVYRLDEGGRVRLNPTLIPGSALRSGGLLSQAGQSYAWTDPLPGGSYLLEDIDLSGAATMHGPIYARSTGPSLLTAPAPGRPASAPYRRVRSVRAIRASRRSVKPSFLAGSAAVKLLVRRDGLHRVASEQLIEAGLPARLDPDRLRLYDEGDEVAIRVVEAADGYAIEFYATGADTPYTDARAYWLMEGKGRGLRIRDVDPRALVPGDVSFSETLEIRERSLYFPGLLNGEEENFFGKVVAATPVEEEVRAPGLVPGTAAEIEVSFQGVTNPPGSGDHRIHASLNGHDLGVVTFDGQSRGVLRSQVPPGVLTSANTLSTWADGPSPDVSLLEAVRVTYRRALQVPDGGLLFVARGGERLQLAASGAIRFLDVTDPARALEIKSRDAGGSWEIVAPGRFGQLRSLFAFHPGDAQIPEATANEPSKWLSRQAGADLMIVAPDQFDQALGPLRALRESQGLKTALVHVEDIYDEVSCGRKDPAAMRLFISEATRLWRRKPRFVLLAGDASYDPRGYLGPADDDVIPTGTVAAGTLETASDDWLVDWNDDGAPELAIGRLPARNAAECQAMVAKILAQEVRAKGAGVFVADADDGFGFSAAARDAASRYSGRAAVISRGQLGLAAARARFREELLATPSLVSYFGHGSIDFWRGPLFSAGDAAGAPGSVWALQTCMNGYFTEPRLESLAEALLRSPGGAAAAWASSAYCAPDEQVRLHDAWLRALTSGKKLGEAVLAAKRGCNDPTVRRTWILFGDPTMRLR